MLAIICVRKSTCPCWNLVCNVAFVFAIVVLFCCQSPLEKFGACLF